MKKVISNSKRGSSKQMKNKAPKSPKSKVTKMPEPPTKRSPGYRKI